MHSTDTNYVIANNAATIISRVHRTHSDRGDSKVAEWLHDIIYTLREAHGSMVKVCDLDGPLLEIYVDQQIEFLVTHGIKHNTTQEYERGL